MDKVGIALDSMANSRMSVNKAAKDALNIFIINASFLVFYTIISKSSQPFIKKALNVIVQKNFYDF